MLSQELMQSIRDLLALQSELVLMMCVGFVLRKKGILTDDARSSLSEIAFTLLIPCSTIKSYLNSTGLSVLQSCWRLLLVAVLMQSLCVALNHVLYQKQPESHRHLLQYMTLCSNSGFLGVAVSGSLYGDLGLLYNSVYIVPQRIFMWTVGMGYFQEKASGRKTLKKAFLHPCLVGMYIGLALMIFQIQMPGPVVKTVTAFGNCVTPVAMLITGAVLTDIDFKTFLNKESLYFSVIRLVLLPLIAFLICTLLSLNSTAKNIATLMAGMPAATITVLFTAKYGGNAKLATKCVVLTTFLSTFTIPLWAILLSL